MFENFKFKLETFNISKKLIFRMESRTSNLTAQIYRHGDYQLRYSRPGIYVRAMHAKPLPGHLVNLKLYFKYINTFSVFQAFKTFTFCNSFKLEHLIFSYKFFY